MPAILRRSAYRVAWWVLTAYRFVTRPTVRGVRCAILRGGDVLLVRHTYGDRGWALPGGLLRRREEPEEAARREMREEVGIDIAHWRALGMLRFIGPERAKHVVECFAADVPEGQEPRANKSEIGQVGWFPVDRLPDETFRHTDEMVERARAT